MFVGLILFGVITGCGEIQYEVIPCNALPFTSVNISWQKSELRKIVQPKGRRAMHFQRSGTILHGPRLDPDKALVYNSICVKFANRNML